MTNRHTAKQSAYLKRRQIAHDRADAHLQAIVDGRSVRYPELGTIVDYPTTDARDEATSTATVNGISWAILTP